MNFEEFVEACDDKDLVDLRVDIRKTERAVFLIGLVVDGDQRAECGGGQVVNIGKVDEKLRAAFLLDDRGDFIADRLDVGFVENIAVDKLDLCDFIDLRNLESGIAHPLSPVYIGTKCDESTIERS